MADEQLLLTLSERVVDDEYSLANLLRTCLLLGARTGSTLLREWAERELHGYGPDDEVPDYRRKSLPLFRDTIGGNYHVTGEQIHREMVPSDLREGVPEFVDFKQSIDELEAMASATKPPRIGMESFPLVASLWTRKLSMFQSVNGIYYQPTTTTFIAIVGTVRTTLVEIVADLVSEAPIQLPSKNKVDSVVNYRINNVSGDHNEVMVGSNTGAVGAGTESTQVVNHGVLPDELTQLFTSIRDLTAGIHDADNRADAEQAVEDFEAEVLAAEPQPSRVRTRARALLATCEKIAIPALTSAATTLTTEGLQALGLS